MNRRRGSNQHRAQWRWSPEFIRDFWTITALVAIACLVVVKLPSPKVISPLAEPVYAWSSPEPTPTQTPAPQQTLEQKILIYLVQVFGDDADKAIVMIKTCENGTFSPTRMSGVNFHKDGRKTIDVGVMQINVDVENTKEIERLKDYKYNIDRGYEKYKMGDGRKHRNSFYLWTCGHVVGDYTYVDRMNGR